MAVSIIPPLQAFLGCFCNVSICRVFMAVSIIPPLQTFHGCFYNVSICRFFHDCFYNTSIADFSWLFHDTSIVRLFMVVSIILPLSGFSWLFPSKYLCSRCFFSCFKCEILMLVYSLSMESSKRLAHDVIDTVPYKPASLMA